MKGTEIITSTAAVTADSNLTSLFNQFVSYIDRGQQTTRSYLINLRQFAAWLRYAGVMAPERKDIIAYRDYLLSEHDAIELDPTEGWRYRLTSAGTRYTVTCKASTVKQYLQSVRQFFAWTAAGGLYPNIAENVHAPRVRSDIHRKDALKPADVQTIETDIKAAAKEKAEAAAESAKDTAGRISRATEQGKRIYAMYVLAVNAGLRTIEISRADVRDIEIRDGEAVIFLQGKGHAEKDTPKALAPEVYAAIKDYLDSRSDRPAAASPLFVSTGNRSRGQRIAPTTISKMLKGAMVHAGYDSDRLTAHSLRHTAGNCVRKMTGNNIYEAQRYMRHSSPATTEIYMHDDDLDTDTGTAAKLYGYYHGASAGSDLDAIVQRMSAAQVAQLTAIAAAIAG